MFRKAAEVLANGGVISMFMAGVMGFLCDATNPNAVNKIFDIKRRPMDQPLVLVSNGSTLREVVDIEQIDPDFRKTFNLGKYDWGITLQELIWSYPIHVIFPKKPDTRLSKCGVEKPDVFTREASISCFWYSSYKPLKQLFAYFRESKPESILAGSSANITGDSVLRTANDVREFFRIEYARGDLSMIIEMSHLERNYFYSGSHSMIRLPTIIDPCEPKVDILRNGSVNAITLRKIFGEFLRGNT